jgi:hypothetical protein
MVSIGYTISPPIIATSGLRFVDGGVDEGEAHASRMDDWILWEAGEETERAVQWFFGSFTISLIPLYV